MEKAAEIAKTVAEAVKVGAPEGEGVQMGPIAHKAQWTKVQSMIGEAKAEGAILVAGGQGKPEGAEDGYFVKPTVFSHVTEDMTIAREEVFGPVLAIIGYKDEDDAVRIANDSPYGLSGAVQSADTDRARRVAKRLRTGMVLINGASDDIMAPFGGYKQSGNGREWGAHAFEDYLEIKSVMGFGEDD